MRRSKPGSRKDAFSDIFVRVDREIARSPLDEVATGLKDAILQRRCAIDEGGDDPAQSRALVHFIDRILSSLPKSFGDRFDFDSTLINRIAQTIATGQEARPFPLVPRASGDWGHQVIDVLVPVGLKICPVSVFHFPGGDDLSDVDLLDYAFLAHEFGHELVRGPNSPFRKLIELEISQFAAAMRLRAISDRGDAKRQAQDRIALILDHWTPTDRQHDWAHELAIDAIAFWLCGPAYVDSLADHLERGAVDPYHVSLGHPPYAVRAEGLILASETLGVPHFAAELRRKVAEWDEAKMHERRAAEYDNLADPIIVKAVVSCAIRTCETLGLVRCLDDTITNVRRKIHAGDTLEPDLELILAAWIQFKDLGGQRYGEWEKQVIGAILQSVKR